jgi:hypothetical protein
MASREEKGALFKLIGLGEKKIEETIKNESLSNLLVEVINQVSEFTKFKVHLEIHEMNR